MAAPHPIELRERVVVAVESGMSMRKAAEVFGVGLSSVFRWCDRYRKTGELRHRPMGGARRGILDDEGLSEVDRLVAEKPDRTLNELKEAFEERTGRKTSASGGISRAIKRLGINRKKKSIEPSERSKPHVMELRAKFMAKQAGLDPARLVFIDETGVHVSMTRRYARGYPGQRIKDDVPKNRGTVTTIIGALTVFGLEAVMMIVGGTSGDVFVEYVKRVLVPLLIKGDIVVLDNLGAHKDKRVRPLIEAAGASVLFLPPYSPEFNPIEECWSKFKETLRKIGARTRGALEEAIDHAIGAITDKDVEGWFTHANYSLST